MGLAADVGTLGYLPKITGNQSLARELAYTARTFSSDEAMRLGLVSRVVDGSREAVVGAALRLADDIASKSPIAVSGTKRLLLHARDHRYDFMHGCLSAPFTVSIFVIAWLRIWSILQLGIQLRFKLRLARRFLLFRAAIDDLHYLRTWRRLSKRECLSRRKPQSSCR